MKKQVKFRRIKSEIRILGMNDGIFIPRHTGMVNIIGVIFRGGRWLEGVMRTEAEVDGMDATEKIAKMIVRSPHHKQLRVIMLSGLTFAGFNIVDIKQLFKMTGLPVIALTTKKPDLEKIKEALKNLPNWRIRWQAVKNAGRIIPIKTKSDAAPVYVQIAGIKREDAKEIVKISCTRSHIPEALRVAHILASGLSETEVNEKI